MGSLGAATNYIPTCFSATDAQGVSLIYFVNQSGSISTIAGPEVVSDDLQYKSTVLNVTAAGGDTAPQVVGGPNISAVIYEDHVTCKVSTMQTRVYYVRANKDSNGNVTYVLGELCSSDGGKSWFPGSLDKKRIQAVPGTMLAASVAYDAPTPNLKVFFQQSAGSPQIMIAYVPLYTTNWTTFLARESWL